MTILDGFLVNKTRKSKIKQKQEKTSKKKKPILKRTLIKALT